MVGQTHQSPPPPLVLTIDRPSLDAIDLSHLARYTQSSYITYAAGQEHYKLLALLSSQLPPGSRVADLGTFQGASALALAHNSEVLVDTYDVEDRSTLFDHAPFAIRTHRANCLDCVWDYADASLIVLDIDPHDGEQETDLLVQLELHNFCGILICDDISLNDGMKKFWAGVQNCWREKLDRVPAYKCIDATVYGHWSGTGIVVFDPTFIDVEVKL